jgi:hypothetical protein
VRGEPAHDARLGGGREAASMVLSPSASRRSAANAAVSRLLTLRGGRVAAITGFPDSDGLSGRALARWVERAVAWAESLPPKTSNDAGRGRLAGL